MEPSGTEALVGVFWFLVLAVLYLIPTLVAAGRKVPNIGSVAVVNILLGWTLIGWVVALAMAARSAAPTATQGAIAPTPVAPPSPTSGSSDDSTLAYCSQCGAQAVPGHRFCGKCGTSLAVS